MRSWSAVCDSVGYCHVNGAEFNETIMNIVRNPYRPSFSLPKLSDPEVKQVERMKVLSIKDMFAALRLGIVPSVVCGVLAVGSAMAIVSQITPQYTSTTTLMFSGLQLDNKVIGGEIAIMRSNQVIAQVAKALQVENVVAFNPHLQQAGASERNNKDTFSSRYSGPVRASGIGGISKIRWNTQKPFEHISSR